MKRKILSLLVILGLLAVLPLAYTGRFDPVSAFEDIWRKGTADIGRLKRQASVKIERAVSDTRVRVYQWRDEHGVMQYGNTPPPGVSAQPVEVHPDRNVVQPVAVPPADEPAQAGEAPLAAPYSVKGMKQVLDDARGVEQQLQKSHERRRQIIDKL